jgi:hypothetical protein
MLFARCCALTRLPATRVRLGSSLACGGMEYCGGSIATLPTPLLARPRLGKDNAIKTRQDKGASAI